jgi:hypothetical protein
VNVVATGMHNRNLITINIFAIFVLVNSKPVFSSMGSASMSVRNIITGPSPFSGFQRKHSLNPVF